MDRLLDNLNSDWFNALKEEIEKPYFRLLIDNLNTAEKRQSIIYPPQNKIFNAFNKTSPTNVKVVILGQDPYHGPGQAMGLSFSVPEGIKTPPSLKNIYKELNTDLNIPITNHGDLTHWAKQGVFLLNAILTVEHKNPGSHKKWGWQIFTDHVIQYLSRTQINIVFMLWGNFAKNKANLIDHTKHLVLEAPHPSPLARGGFFDCKHFSKANDYLISNNKTPIDWKLPPKTESNNPIQTILNLD